ncbi:META domain-containing protein [Streptomyces sp. NPDC086766]|uniref:META domain-containing protein n=1 Tax=Streptomyces sp. NPDC086766 TaxID=3365754 RepID=UPI0037F7B5B4
MDTQRLTLAVLTVLPLAVACGSGTGGAGPGGDSAAPDVKAVTGVHLSADDLTGERLTRTTADGDRASHAREQDAPLRSTRWNVTALGAGHAVVSPPQGARAYLVLGRASGKVTGSLGCNRVTAGATVRGGRIALGRASTTRMMCDASLMDVEKRLLRLFDSTVSWRIDHRTLTLTSENGVRVTAVAAQ